METHNTVQFGTRVLPLS